MENSLNLSVIFTETNDEPEIGMVEAFVGPRCYVKVPNGKRWPRRRMIWTHEIQGVVPWN